MYQIGELIVYGSEGVCRVMEIGPLGLDGADRERLYYTLAPLYRDGKVFIPVDTNVFMRPILSRSEAEKLVASIPDIEAEVCKERNPRLLGEYYQDMMRSHSCDSMVRLIKTAYRKTQARRARGGKPGQVDERYLKWAEDLLYGELAAALGMDRGQVRAYIFQVAEAGAGMGPGETH